MSPLLDYLLQECDGFRTARLPSLYSDFQLQRHSNPDGFDANYSAWIGALIKASRTKSLPPDISDNSIFSLRTSDALPQALETRELGRPLALGAVIDEALSKRKLMPRDEFLAATRDINGRSWTVEPWWLLSWLFKQVNPFGGGPAHVTLPKGQFLVLESLEQASNLILSKLSGATRRIDRTYPMSAFKHGLGEILGLKGELSTPDTEVLLKHLARDKDAIRYNESVVVIKAKGENDRFLSSEDIAVADLKAAISELQKQIELLAKAVVTYSDKAKQALSDKNRPIAMTALKMRKLKEAALAQRAESLSRLEEVLDSIEQATDNLTILSTMKQSTSVLQSLQAQLGGVDRVQDVVDQLKDETQKVTEVESLFQEAQQQGSSVDDEEVEEELQAILQRTMDEEAAKTGPKAEDFPQIPPGPVRNLEDPNPKVLTQQEISRGSNDERIVPVPNS